MRHRLYAHLVWTTLDRDRLIDVGRATFLCGFLRGMARKDGAAVLAVGLVQTHVHLLIAFTPTTPLATLVQHLKGASSAVARTEGHGVDLPFLRWAKGYAIHSISGKDLVRVRGYLESQPAHHPTEAISGWSGDTVDPYDNHWGTPPLRRPAERSPGP